MTDWTTKPSLLGLHFGPVIYDPEEGNNLYSSCAGLQEGDRCEDQGGDRNHRGRGELQLLIALSISFLVRDFLSAIELQCPRNSYAICLSVAYLQVVEIEIERPASGNVSKTVS